MTEFPFNWILNNNAIDPKRNRYISNLKINNEWNLICVWNHNGFRPEVLEIHRNSTVGDIMVSGIFKLMGLKTHSVLNTIIDHTKCLIQRKFNQLIVDGFAITQLEMISSLDGCNFQNYSIKGTLIPSGVAHMEYPSESSSDLLSDFERLLDPKATYFSDANLTCGSDSFPVHKNILSVRSPVFAAMFTTEMKENRENKVNISDISPHVLKTMLFYIYTGKTGELSVQSAGELLFAADKYQLKDLKRKCSDYLQSNMTVENVLNTLVLGYLHEDDLKDFAMDFICRSYKDFEAIEEREDWENLREKRPPLVMDVLTRMVKYLKTKC